MIIANRSPFLRSLSISRGVALIYVTGLVIVVIFGYWLMPYDPLQQNIGNRLLLPLTKGHLLGTDAFGRDILSRLIAGARVEMVVGVLTTVVASVLGCFIGLVGGYFGRITKAVTMRGFVDVLLAFPPIVLALLGVAISGPGAATLIIVMGVLFSPIFARITYSQVITIKHEEYVQAAQTFGAPTWEILVKGIFPNASAPIIAQLSLTMAEAILLESGLSFLGLGIVPPTPSWGSMVGAGQRYIASHPYLIIPPSVALVATILSFSIIGDFLQDYLDPRKAN